MLKYLNVNWLNFRYNMWKYVFWKKCNFRFEVNLGAPYWRVLNKQTMY